MYKKIFSLLVLIAILVVFYALDFQSYLSLDHIKSQQQNFQNFYQQQPSLTLFIFFSVYVFCTALSIPGAALLTLLAGSLFGLGVGTLIVSFASTLGAGLAFLGTRFFLGEFVRTRFANYLKTINDGVTKNGAYYLLSLRLIPAVPFFIVNLVFGLTSMRWIVFCLVSHIGMLPGTIAYVNAGTQLAQIENLKDVLSPTLIGSFVLLGILPLLIRFLTNFLAQQKMYRRFKKPKSFDYNIVAIGAGAAGLVTSYIAAAAKAKVALIEKHKMGGDCLNTGCIPSKSLIRTAHFLNDIKKSKDLGIEHVDVQFDFKQIMKRVQRIIKTIEPHDSVERYSQLGVDCLLGSAQIKSPWEVEVNGKTLTTKNIVIATGASPFVPDLPGLSQCRPLTSDTLWNLQELPEKLLVLGGGAIGLELAQSFARLGSQVTLVERAPRLLPKEDSEVSDWISKKLISEGVQVFTGFSVESFQNLESHKMATAKDAKGQTQQILFNEVLVALGRKAHVNGFGLEELGIELTEQKSIKTNAYLQTNFANIFACGDVTGMYQFTHTAAHQAWFTSMNALLRPFYAFRADHSLIPWCIYTDPEVARVGLNESEALAKNIPYEISFFNIDHLDRALTEESAYGFVKVLIDKKSDRILGATIVGPHAGECLAEFVLAMKHGLGFTKILQTIHIYPTLTEANKFAAGQWRKSKVSDKLIKLSESFNKWQRS